MNANCQGDGTLTLQVNAGTAVDARGDASSASASSVTIPGREHPTALIGRRQQASARKVCRILPQRLRLQRPRLRAPPVCRFTASNSDVVIVLSPPTGVPWRPWLS